MDKVLYVSNDTVLVLLRSDTNSRGYCEWFNFGVKWHTSAPLGLRIKIRIINLRKKCRAYAKGIPVRGLRLPCQNDHHGKY